MKREAEFTGKGEACFVVYARLQHDSRMSARDILYSINIETIKNTLLWMHNEKNSSIANTTEVAGGGRGGRGNNKKGGDRDF